MVTTLTSSRLSYLNLKGKIFRTLIFISIVAILSFVLFGGTVLSHSMKKGLSSLEMRLGGDLIVVPLGYEQKQESILLTGEPSYFYFDKEILGKLKGVEGISKLSPQFYLTSLNASCCSLPLQIVGFDPETDFLVQPWIREVLGKNLEKGALIVGSDVLIEEDRKIKLFDQGYLVAAKLDKTGTGLDQTVFATMDTIKSIYSDAKDKGLYFSENTNPDTSISSIFIKVQKDYDIDQVVTNIRQNIDGVQIIKSKTLISSIADSFSHFTTVFYAFALAFLVITLAVLTAMFSASVNERKKEFAMLRILGATRKKVASILFWESLYISVTGSVLGIGLAALVVFPYNVFIGDSIGVPYLQPSLLWIFVIGMGTLLTAIGVSILASIYSVIKINRFETYLILREGE
jgi:putative ABC transport system permease protein